jgi:hypothetical protein
MTPAGFRLFLHRFRWPVTAAVLVLAYTLAGFFLLPWLLQRYLTRTLATDWQHTVEVRAVRFNPFLIRLEVDDARLLDSDNTPLLSLAQFVFDYEVPSVFRLEYGIEELTLNKPYVKLVANGNGGYSLTDIFTSSQQPASNEPPQQQEQAAGPLPAVFLRKVALLDGVVDYRDPQRANGFHQVIDLPELVAEDLHTRQGQHGNRLQLSLRDRDAGEIAISTTVKLQPLQLQGDFSVNNLNLAPVWQWLMLPVNFQLQAPRLDIATRFDLQVPDAVGLQVQGGSLSLRDLVISGKDAPDAPVIRLPLLAVKDVQLDLLKQSASVASLEASDGFIDVVLGKDGSNNLQQLFAPAEAVPASTAPAAEPAPTKPWDVLIRQVAISNYTIQFRDDKPSQPFAAKLAPLSVSIADWKPLAPDRFAVLLNTGISSQTIEQAGKLALDVQLQLSPLQVDAKLDLQQLPLALVQPYIHDVARVDISQGMANAGLTIHVESSDTFKLDLQGNAGVDALDVHEKGTDRKLLGWNKLAVDGLSFQLPDNRLQINQIALAKLNSGFVINADGTTNVHDLMVPQPPAEKSSTPLQMAINKIVIDDADLGFADLSMKPNFRVAMQQLSGSIDGLSSDPKTQAAINLKGKVDRYAPVTIKGKLNPLAPKPSLDAHMAFSNLELTTFTPYSGTYAGFRIDRGQLSLDIDYKLVNDRIQGKNRIVMNQLQLGESVQSNKAVDLPLRLAIALLRDEKGVIDLGFEVSGDLNDPKFSVGGIIWKVLSNMIMKVVTSPFNALSAMMGADAEGIDQIVFVPGSEQPDELSRKKLQTAAGMLAKRSGLSLNVQGNTLREQDAPAIQKQRLLAALQEGNTVPAEAFLSGQAALDNGDAYKLLGRYYKQQRNDELGDVQDRIKADLKARGEDYDRQKLKVLAYEQAWQRLQDAVAVSDDDLRQLAMQRARGIKAILVEQQGVAPERVFVMDANSDPAKASLTSFLTLDAR